MLRYSVYMLWWEVRLGLSLLVLFWLARLWGLVDHVLELLTLHFVLTRIKLPVDLDLSLIHI